MWNLVHRTRVQGHVIVISFLNVLQVHASLRLWEIQSLSLLGLWSHLPVMQTSLWFYAFDSVRGRALVFCSCKVITDMLACQAQDVPQRQGIPQLPCQPALSGAQLLCHLTCHPQRNHLLGDKYVVGMVSDTFLGLQFPMLLCSSVNPIFWPPGTMIHLPASLPRPFSVTSLSFQNAH